MSAFVVDKVHINAMITAGLIRSYGSSLRWYHDGEWHELTHDNASQIGQMLLDENVASVMGRYDNSKITELPGRTNAEWLIPFAYRLTHNTPTAVETIKLTQCFEYQSCEHPEWETSQSKEFCQSLIHAQYDRLPGYEAAPWEWTKPITENLIRLV